MRGACPLAVDDAVVVVRIRDVCWTHGEVVSRPPASRRRQRRQLINFRWSDYRLANNYRLQAPNRCNETAWQDR
jgi:hypothetical protein